MPPTAPKSSLTFQRSRRVLVGDDDGSGLLYFPIIYHFMSEGDQEALFRLGRAPWDRTDDGLAPPVVSSSCDYLHPARAGDLLIHSVTVALGANSSMILEHGFALENGTRIAQGRVVRVWVDLRTMQPRPVPEDLRALENGLESSAESTAEAG